MDPRQSTNLIPLEGRLIDAIEAIEQNKNRCVVVQSHNTVVGVLSEGDIMRALLHGADIHSPIEDWISHDFKFLSDVNYFDSLKLMIRYGITMIPIIDSNFHLQEVITISDVLRHLHPSEDSE